MRMQLWSTLCFEGHVMWYCNDCGMEKLIRMIDQRKQVKKRDGHRWCK